MLPRPWEGDTREGEWRESIRQSQRGGYVPLGIWRWSDSIWIVCSILDLFYWSWSAPKWPVEFDIATVQSCLGVIEKKYNTFLSRCLPGELPYFPDYSLRTIHIQKLKFHPIWTIYRWGLYKELFFSQLFTVTGHEGICEQSILMIQASLWANTAGISQGVLCMKIVCLD